MFANYRAVFRAPGSPAFCAAGFVMRVPMAIYPLGLVLIGSARSGHYGFAGLLSACFVLGAAPGAQVTARLVDRFGQRRILPPASAAHVAAVVVLAVLIDAHAPDWTWLVPTVVAGFAFLSVGSLIRARWSYVLGGDGVSAAYSLESTLDELIFVIGPLIATLIATHADPSIVLYLSIALVSAGAAWLAVQHHTEPPAQPADAPAHPSALRQPGVVLLTLAACAMGATFAAAEVSMVAFCGQHGHRSLSGVVLALFAAGSGASGLIYGSRSWRGSTLSRFRLQAMVFAVLPVLFLAAVNVGALAVCAFVTGLGIAPTLINAFGLVNEIVPSGSLVEGLTWLMTGLNVGYGIGSAVVGSIADAHGARTAFTVSIAAAVLTGVAAIVLYARSTGGSRAGGSSRRPAVAPSDRAPLP